MVMKRMAQHKPIYIWSKNEAIKDGDIERWRESHKENCDCARTIEKTIQANYKNNVLNKCAKPVIEQYGFNRVNWVLANTIQRNGTDERFSGSNKEWSKGFYIPHDDDQWHYEVASHQGLVDLFVTQVRNAWQELGLYDNSHCCNVKDYEDQVLILRPSTLNDEYKKPEFQLFYATTGNGCRPDAIGTSVFGFFLKDGERTSYRRGNFYGVIDQKYLPDWAKDAVAEYQKNNIENQSHENTPNLSM